MFVRKLPLWRAGHVCVLRGQETDEKGIPGRRIAVHVTDASDRNRLTGGKPLEQSRIAGGKPPATQAGVGDDEPIEGIKGPSEIKRAARREASGPTSIRRAQRLDRESRSPMMCAAAAVEAATRE